MAEQMLTHLQLPPQQGRLARIRVFKFGPRGSLGGFLGADQGFKFGSRKMVS